jgi:hypothetical protein
MLLPDSKFWRPSHYRESWETRSRGLEKVRISDAGALICDPIYLYDYFDLDDDVSSFISEHAIVFRDEHGGRIYEGPHGIIICPELAPPDYLLLHDGIDNDSWHFLMLSLTDELPEVIAHAIPGILEENCGGNAARLTPRPGFYSPFCASLDGRIPDMDQSGDITILKRA